MTEANSPTYRQGLRDGYEDEARIKSCPSLSPYGPCPPFPRYRVMYDRGYWAAYSDRPHVCTERCRRAQDDQNGYGDSQSSGAWT